MYRGDWRRTENVKAQSELLKQWLVEKYGDGVGMNDIRPIPIMMVCRDSVIGIVTRYRLNGPGIESRWGEIFHARPDGPGAHQTSNTMGIGSFPGAKRSWRGVVLTTHPRQTPGLKKEWRYAFTVPIMMKINKLLYTASSLCTPAVRRKQYMVQALSVISCLQVRCTPCWGGAMDGCFTATCRKAPAPSLLPLSCPSSRVSSLLPRFASRRQGWPVHSSSSATGR